MLGIYEVDGDALQICYGPEGVTRPNECGVQTDLGWFPTAEGTTGLIHPLLLTASVLGILRV